MQSKAATVDQYLAELPPDRRETVEAVRALILKNLPKGYAEGIQYGIIGYFVPHSIFPPGYHCDPKQPLPFAGLASQKNYLSLYLGCVYDDGERAAAFREAWTKTGKKLDMGKACIRFRRLDDLPLEVIANAIKRAPVKKYIEFYEKAMQMNAERRAERTAKKKVAAKPKSAAAGPAKKNVKRKS